MKHKQIIEAHRAAVAEAQGKREETGHFVGIMIEIKPIITWQERIKDSPLAPPNTPVPGVAVKESNRCCVVM